MREVGAVIDSPFAHGELAWAQRRGVARELGARGYTQAIVLPNSLKSALVPWLAGIPVRTGYIGEQRYGLVNDRRRLDVARLPRLVDRFAALASRTAQRRNLRFPSRHCGSIRGSSAAALERLGLTSSSR
jgi:heptosyltransferase-2